MYGESGYHGAYAAGQSEVGSSMHKSPSGSKCCLNCGSSLPVSPVWTSMRAACRKATSLSRHYSCCTKAEARHACAGLYQGRFGQASFNTDDQHTTDDSNNSTGMPATHTDAEASAYQGRFGTMPQAKLFEPQYSGELERKGSAYHGKFSQ